MSATETKNWKLIGGKLCVDFVNTVGGRILQNENSILDYKIITDKLESFSDLADWAKAVGILSEASAKKVNLFAVQNDQAAKKLLVRTLQLRESLYKIFVNIIEGNIPPGQDLELLNDECYAAREKQKLFYHSNKFNWTFETIAAGDPEIIIMSVSLSASEFLVNENLSRLKQCGGENCGWLFLDTSKNGSRQWCDMKDCGNAAKVRRFREKLK